MFNNSKNTQEQQINELRNELDYWKQYTPVNNTGKMAQLIKIQSLTNQIEVLEKNNIQPKFKK